MPRAGYIRTAGRIMVQQNKTFLAIPAGTLALIVASIDSLPVWLRSVAHFT